MKAIHKILVPVDFSATATQALHFALVLAGHLTAEVHLLHVIYPQMENIDAPTLPVDRATLAKESIAAQKLQDLIEAAKLQLTQAGKPFPATGVHVVLGGAIAVIRAQVKEKKYDLIIMGTRGSHPGLDKFLGTVASDVVGNASCPVIVVPENAGGREIAKIAHAIEPAGLNTQQLFDITKQLHALHRELHLVQFNRSDSPDSSGKLLQLKAALAEQLKGVPIAIHNLNKQELVADMNHFVQKAGIDLLIMYRSPSGFFRKLFHRSRTREMARNITIPLLVV